MVYSSIFEHPDDYWRHEIGCVDQCRETKCHKALSNAFFLGRGASSTFIFHKSPLISLQSMSMSFLQCHETDFLVFNSNITHNSNNEQQQ